MKNLSVLPLLALIALLAGCAGDSTVSTDDPPAADGTAEGASPDESEAVATDNRMCPIMGHPVTADGGSVAWNGKKIGFCCEGCQPEFEKLSDEEKTAKLAEAAAGAHGKDEGETEEKPAESTES